MAFARGKSNEDDDDNRTNSQAVPPGRKTENLGKLGARLVGHRHRAVTSPPAPRPRADSGSARGSATSGEDKAGEDRRGISPTPLKLGPIL